MSSRCDEVQKNMHSVVAIPDVTLDSRFCSEDVVKLLLKILHNLPKAKRDDLSVLNSRFCISSAYQASLSIWSPNPGVSTTVRDTRVPSSSNSSSDGDYQWIVLRPRCALVVLPTVVGLIWTPSSRCALAGSSISLPARTVLSQSVLTKVVRPIDDHQSYPTCKRRGPHLTCSRLPAHHHRELDDLLRRLLLAHFELQLVIVSPTVGDVELCGKG